MDFLRSTTENKGSFKPHLLTPAKGFIKGKRRRPVISGPIGPIKNSRGPDFIRSETLVIVPRITDCSSDESLTAQKTIDARKTTRRISAGFSSQGPLASNPTVAKSNFNAVTTCQASNTTQSSKIFLEESQVMVSSSPLVFTSSCSTTDLLGCQEVVLQDENTPVNDENVPPPAGNPTNVSKSKIPKSRTMSVLQDIKTSISRPSLNARSVTSRNFSSFSRKFSDSRKVSDSSSTSTLTKASEVSATATSTPQGSSRRRIPRPSLASLSRSSPSSTPGSESKSKPKPNQINIAQPSAYWSGRFVALNDRFATEALLSDSTMSPSSSDASCLSKPGTKPGTPDRFPPRSSSFQPRRFTKSDTTSNLNAIPFPEKRKHHPDDEEARCRRVFIHLDSLCATADARSSLHDFQQAYARRVNRPGLLPNGGCMEEKSLMNKIFRGVRKSEGHATSAPKESANSAAVRKALGVKSIGSRGKRASIY